ncbi:hypothetical protein SAY86_008888 [Trapa natans]|uniref:Uncharacterized protein n=1 Tax=Trapa natans TaxID=22666 RepID=A0AAN7KHY7_TRANT|nr:hypothetical protein SAY86_008888 [Trapa natans]
MFEFSSHVHCSIPSTRSKAMEDLGSIWAFEESMEEVKQRLLCTTIELERVKVEAGEKMMKYRQNIMHLLGLLKLTYQERDEARGQLHRLLDKLAAPRDSSTVDELLFHGLQPDSCLMPAKANSTLTESTNSIVSPADSFFGSSSLVLENQRQNTSIQEYVGAEPLVGQPFDPRMTMIDELAKGKILPQKGKLLETVMEAGPLLHTLLVAGRLPQWRDPPPLHPISIPPTTSIKGFHPPGIGQMPLHGSGMHRANPQMCSASIPCFPGATGLLCNSSHRPSSSPSNGNPVVKRERFL